jgi:lipopolysaccharide transport system permease protein
MKILTIFPDIWQKRELIKQFTMRDLNNRYKGSFLGVLWSMLTPLLMLAIYSVVFTQVFKVRWMVSGVDQGNFTLMIFVGMIIYQIFSESLGRAATVIAGYSNLIKKVVFPAEVLPISVVLSGLINAMLGMVVLVAAVPIAGERLSLTMLYLPLVLLPLLLLTMGLVFLVAVLGVFIKDMNNIISILVTAIYFMSPVFYSVSMVPPRFQLIMHINPLTDIIENTRNIIIYGQPPAWHSYLYVLAASLAIFIAGYLFFINKKELFADVI